MPPANRDETFMRRTKYFEKVLGWSTAALALHFPSSFSAPGCSNNHTQSHKQSPGDCL